MLELTISQIKDKCKGEPVIFKGDKTTYYLNNSQWGSQ